MNFRVPVVRGTIDRRMLINFRVAPEVLQGILPEPFRVKTVHGLGMAGICLIRLNNMRVRFAPAALGLTSENAAHRIAVEWDENGRVREGVFIPRRDTSSRFNQLAGGRLFPGIHNLAKFNVRETDTELCLHMESDDGVSRVVVEARTAQHLPEGSIFHSVAEASEFFERGALGYSIAAKPGEFDGLELKSFNWHVTPLAVHRVESSFFGDRSRFPAGSVEFDSALLMRGIEHEWLGRRTFMSATFPQLDERTHRHED